MKTSHKIFLAKCLAKAVFFFFKKKIFQVKRCGIYWELDINEGIDLSIFLFGKFEDQILSISKNIIKNNKIDIIDIGSNIGVHTLRFAKIYNQSKVYSIEPTNYSFNKMMKNLQLNCEIKNVLPFQYFLSDKNFKPDSTYSSWDLSSNENRHSQHLGVQKSTSEAKTISLDDFILKNNIDRKTLIKCDVDGNEMGVFKSGKNYFKKYKPYIIMELAPYLYQENGYSCEELLKFLLNLKYEFYDANTYEKINDINDYSSKIQTGSSVNIFLM